MKRKADEKDLKATVSAGGERKPYVAPTVTEHGAVEAVTERGGVRSTDSLIGT